MEQIISVILRDISSSEGTSVGDWRRSVTLLFLVRGVAQKLTNNILPSIMAAIEIEDKQPHQEIMSVWEDKRNFCKNIIMEF